jgi:transposase
MEMAASTTKKMQKYLRLMNLRLDFVVKDTCGLTGLKIIDAICQGGEEPEKLASFRHGNCHKSEEEITKALQSNGRKDYLFALRQEYEIYEDLQKKMDQCNIQIKQFMEDVLKNQPGYANLKAIDKPHKRINNNAPKNFDLNQFAYKYFGSVDLMEVEGLSLGSIHTLMREVGADGYKKFAFGKQFASWLRLAPNKRISGGKILSNRIPKGSNRLKIALRQAANAIGNLKQANLYNFFVRICIRKGRSAAITATARKLAIIIWNMIVKKVPYNPPTNYEFLDQKRKRKVREMRKQICKFDISPVEISIVSI